jgi:hypothetical protein
MSGGWDAAITQGAMSLTHLDDLLASRSPRFRDPLLGPPAHVQDEVDAAWERAQDLFADELELHFTVDSYTRRVRGELRSARGETWEPLSAAEALAFACGDAVFAE